MSSRFAHAATHVRISSLFKADYIVRCFFVVVGFFFKRRREGAAKRETEKEGDRTAGRLLH